MTAARARVLPAATIVVLVVLLLCAAPGVAALTPSAKTTLRVAASTAPTATECAVFPRRKVRVRLTSVADEFAAVMPAVAVHIARLWAAEGVQIEWIESENADQRTRADVRIAVLHELDTAPRDRVLGIVQFNRGVPLPLIRVSLKAVIHWLQRQRARQLDAPVLLLPPALSSAPPKLAEALAYVGAHELGHYLLASRRHAASGLMRSVYDHPELLDVSHVWQLDARNRGVLRERMRQGEACDRRARAAASIPVPCV